jgi:hypothetical protein
MALINPPAFLGNAANEYSAARMRRVFQTLLGDVEGVRGTSSLAVTATATPSMNVQVAAGRAWVNGDVVSRQGVYLVENDAVTTVGPIAAASPTLNRTDLIVARVYDASPDGGGAGLDQVRFEVVQGTASAGPNAPALPPSAIPLAEIAIPAGVTTINNARITDLRVASGIGGTPPAARIYSDLDTPLPHLGLTNVPLTVTAFNTSSMWSSTSNTRITIRVPGFYMVSGAAWVQTPATTGRLEVAAVRNGGANGSVGTVISFNGAGPWQPTFSGPLPLAAGDFLTLRCYMESSNGAAGTVLGSGHASPGLTWLSAVRLGTAD